VIASMRTRALNVLMGKATIMAALENCNIHHQEHKEIVMEMMPQALKPNLFQ